MLLALKLVPHRPKDFVVSLRDGRRLSIDLTTGMQESVYFFGKYEPFVTTLVEQLVFEGDVCVDAGANFGWYTTLMAERVGQTGKVHAFEPVPDTFKELTTNVKLLSDPSTVIANQLALSHTETETVINIFEGEPTGHASLASKSKNTTGFRCETVRLDEYLLNSGVSNVDFIKVDVEGAELNLLKGSGTMLGQAVPPVIVMEMAIGQSRHFGYVPNDLIEFIRSRADYDFFQMDEIGRRLEPIDRLADDDPGANVLCVPAAAEDRVQAVVKRHLAA